MAMTLDFRGTPKRSAASPATRPKRDGPAVIGPLHSTLLRSRGWGAGFAFVIARVLVRYAIKPDAA